MFGKLFKKLIPKRFKVTSAKRVPGNGHLSEKIVWAMSAKGAAMDAEPAGRSKIVKAVPIHVDFDDRTGKYTAIYAVTDANNTSYSVTVEEL